MSTIQGGIPFAGLVAPTDSTDTYAVTDEAYNRGGFRTVSTISDRNAITADRQLQGMLVYVKSEDKTYQLSGVIGSNLWIEYKSSGNVTAETLSGVSLNNNISTASGITSIGSTGKTLNVNSDNLYTTNLTVTGSTILNAGISGIVKSTLGSLSSASAGVDYLAPNGNGSQLSGITPSQIGLSFGNVTPASPKVSLIGQTNNSIIGTGFSIDVNDAGINHNALSGLVSGNPHTQYQLLSEKAQASGYASLDSGGKVPLSQLPSTLLQYEGQWDAATNTPTLINPDTSKVSKVYEVSQDGTRFSFDWKIGDWLVYNASGQIERSINSNIVASVFGRTGAVIAQVNDYNKSQVSGLTDIDDVVFNSETLSNLNSNTVLYADASKTLQSSIVTKTQLEYLSGVTSDVQQQINSKLSSNSPIPSGVATKITYDHKGLVLSGDHATTADISDSVDKRYVNDYQKSVVQNTSGVNTGDETNTSIKSKLGYSSASSDGYLSQSDWSTFNNKASESYATNIAISMSIALG